jgi:UDP-N-acetylmuramoylalanine--D-glutamate ligase
MKDKIIILGSGESGVGAAKLAQKQGMEVFVSDFGTIKQAYKDELIALNIPFEEGKHTEEIILSATTVIKSPGIADKVAIIQKIKEKKFRSFLKLNSDFVFQKQKLLPLLALTAKPLPLR